MKMSWFVYILKCSDNTLYTGITTNMERRLKEHNADISTTKYTRARRPVRIAYTKEFESRSEAAQEEVRIKKMQKKEKELFISSRLK